MGQLIQNGAVIHYETWGEQGPWLTLLNGYTRSLKDFRLLGRHLQGLGFRILVLDNRGAGETNTDGPFSIKDLVGDVVALWNTLGISCTGVLGISMGGFIAQTLALDYADYVRNLILISSAATDQWLGSNETPWSTDIEAVKTKLASYFAPSFVERNRLLIQSMAKQIATSVAEGDFADRAKLQKAAIRGFDTRSRLPTLRCPTLVLHGASDQVINKNAAFELSSLIPNCKLTILPEAGHLLLAEAPKSLYEIVGETFKKKFQGA